MQTQAKQQKQNCGAHKRWRRRRQKKAKPKTVCTSKRTHWKKRVEKWSEKQDGAENYTHFNKNWMASMMCAHWFCVHAVAWALYFLYMCECVYAFLWTNSKFESPKKKREKNMRMKKSNQNYI